MNGDLNKREIKWLRKKPRTLLSHYQSIIEVVVARFISRGYFSKEEREELIQEVNLQLLEKKLQKIQEHYNGSVYLRTYFSKVVYNTCLEIARQKKRRPELVDATVLQNKASRELNAYEQTLIKDEMLRFEAILKGVRKQRAKLELCLKLLVRIILKTIDIQWYVAPKTNVEINIIKRHFFQQYDSLTDTEIFSLVIQLFNKLEGKQNDGDSLRRWVMNQIDRMIKILNGDPPMSKHSRDSIKVLMRLYFEKED